MPIKPYQENALFLTFFSFVAFIGIMLSLSNCRSVQAQKTEASQLYGQCWNFQKIEDEVAGNKTCMKTTVNRAGRMWRCTRKQGHRGLCHSHHFESCKWTWR